MSQPRIVPLSKTRHAALTFSPLEDYSFTAAMNSMPLLGFEVVEASRCFAIAFPAAGSAVPHALLGLGGKNVFVDARGRWTAPYLPLYAANHPFSLIAARFPEQEKMPGVVLAVDEDAPHFRRKDGLPLYGEDGALLAYAGVEGEDYVWNADGTWSFKLTGSRTINDVRANVLMYTGAAMPGLYPSDFISKVCLLYTSDAADEL